MGNSQLLHLMLYLIERSTAEARMAAHALSWGEIGWAQGYADRFEILDGRSTLCAAAYRSPAPLVEIAQ